MLFCDEYIHEMEKEVGKGFFHVLFRYEKGLATLFRIETETSAVAKFLAEQSYSIDGFAERCVKELSKIKGELENLMKGDELTKEKLKSFRNLHLKLIPYFLVPIWASNELKNIEGDENKKNALFSLYEKARKDAEHLYPQIEAFLECVYTTIASRHGIEPQLLQALVPDELELYAEQGSLPPINVLKDRYEYSTIYADKTSVEIVLGDSARKLIDDVSAVGGDIKEIKGRKAFGGVARGTVKVVFRDEDGKAFEKGQILVTTMTRPEWLPIMEKAAAFVTDAGGVLCHAAIVAREMKVPCVTDTKIASQVLKDGDMIEVDADNGVVKIII
jgi:phosphohistidine swiveling domain-containing protein